LPGQILKEINRKKNMVIILFLILIAGTVAIFYGYFYKQQTGLDAERESLTATGTVEAKAVMVSFKVPGKIKDFLVDEGSSVEEGQELAFLDSREIEAKLIQAKGAYEAALGQVRQAERAIPLTNQSVEAAIKQAEAVVAKAEVGLTNASQDLNRIEQLYKSGAVSKSQFEKASNAYEAAQKDLDAAQGQLNEALAARTKVEIARAQYDAALGQSKQALGGVEEAQAYLDNTHLISPVSGYITEKMLEKGEMVNAGTPVLEITDLTHPYIKVFITETKIGRVKLQQEAEITVDSFPGKNFKGKVVWINDAGQFAVHKAVNEQYSHDIRSFEVKIDVPNKDLILKTGMTARVKILDEEK